MVDSHTMRLALFIITLIRLYAILNLPVSRGSVINWTNILSKNNTLLKTMKFISCNAAVQFLRVGTASVSESFVLWSGIVLHLSFLPPQTAVGMFEEVELSFHIKYLMLPWYLPCIEWIFFYWLSLHQPSHFLIVIVMTFQCLKKMFIISNNCKQVTHRRAFFKDMAKGYVE